MKKLICVVISGLLALPCAQAQSLAEAARREAERRRQLAEQKVEGKVIEAKGPAQLSRGGLATFNRGAAQYKPPGTVRETRSRTSLTSYRNLLRKLELELLELGERRSSLLRQADAEKWALPKPGRQSRSTSGPALREKLLKQAEGLEIRLKRLERQRLEIRDEAKKAGYLPGELDGKAVAP